MNFAGFDLNQEFIYLLVGIAAFFLSRFVNKADATREDFHKLSKEFAKLEMKADAAFRQIDEIKKLIENK
jgi:hypothetical protein